MCLNKKTKGQIEAEISSAITTFEREHLGRGPDETKTFILHDMVIVRLKGILTPAERSLVKSGSGETLIKEVRAKIIDSARKIIDNIIFDITETRVIHLFTDINSKAGERIFVFTLEKDIQKEMQKEFEP